jgi:hypothetical protein
MLKLHIIIENIEMMGTISMGPALVKARKKTKSPSFCHQ